MALASHMGSQMKCSPAAVKWRCSPQIRSVQDSNFAILRDVAPLPDQVVAVRDFAPTLVPTGAVRPLRVRQCPRGMRAPCARGEKTRRYTGAKFLQLKRLRQSEFSRSVSGYSLTLTTILVLLSLPNNLEPQELLPMQKPDT